MRTRIEEWIAPAAILAVISIFGYDLSARYTRGYLSIYGVELRWFDPTATQLLMNASGIVFYLILAIALFVLLSIATKASQPVWNALYFGLLLVVGFVCYAHIASMWILFGDSVFWWGKLYLAFKVGILPATFCLLPLLWRAVDSDSWKPPGKEWATRFRNDLGEGALTTARVVVAMLLVMIFGRIIAAMLGQSVAMSEIQGIRNKGFLTSLPEGEIIVEKILFRDTNAAIMIMRDHEGLYIRFVDPVLGIDHSPGSGRVLFKDVQPKLLPFVPSE
ncbi:MAG: hypothetical protein KF684_05695 [Phycisphaeraceae bacterium]|nr:hypothetical protein [Phycisphaeraceae bacterium]